MFEPISMPLKTANDSLSADAWLSNTKPFPGRKIYGLRPLEGNYYRTRVEQIMQSRTPSPPFAPVSPTYERREMISPFGSWNSPRYAAGRQDVDQVHVKVEKDFDDDELMTTPIPSPTPNQQNFKRKRAQSSCLPFNSSLLPSPNHGTHPIHDHEHHFHMQEPRIVEVHDDDQMSIQQEAQNKPIILEGENDDAKSESTIITIRHVPRSPFSEFEDRGMDDREFALARTAEYQSALFGMLEEMCTEAARRYWQDVASQGRFCLPSRKRDVGLCRACSHGQYRRHQTGTQPIRTRRSSERFNTRHRVDPYPTRHHDSNLPPHHDHGIRSQIFDFYGGFPSHSAHEDEDTRMTANLGQSSSLEAQDRSTSQQPLTFLELISKIANHIWSTERHHPVAPHRAEFLTAKKCWDIWRLAEVVVRAVDGYDGFNDERFEGFGGGVKCRDEVVGIVEAAGELCGVLGDRVGREKCEELVMSWELEGGGDGLEEGEIVE